MQPLRSLFTGITLFLLVAFSATGQECGIIYVAPNGASSGSTGTRSNPASLTHGLSLSNSTNNIVWLAAGTYTITDVISIPNDVTIEGGFDPGTWVKSNGTPSIINRTFNNTLPPPANALVAIAGLNASGFRLQDLTINVADATAPGISIYGIYLAACSNYSIVRCEVNTGQAGPGLAGGPGTPGTPGAPGSNGLPAGYENAPPPGGAGGAGVNPGGNGGISARWNGSSPGGQAGSGPGGCGGAGGNSGSGANCGCGLFGTSNNNDCEGNNPGPGQPGAVGAAGTAGAPGTPGAYASGYYTLGGPGGNGTAGGNGCGGGGGGGGGGRQQSGNDQTGGSGGGGGAGGGGGTGGTGGTGGGGSFAIFLWNNGSGGAIVDCFANAGPGGAGGAGGPGGAGGAGGAGGNGGPGFGCGTSTGANGGAGGAGGAGGPGGAGIAGPSVDLAEEGGGTPVAANGISAVPGNPPVISVDNYGCTNSDIHFSSPISGAWDFGSGANPQTANGSGPIAVTYPSVGRRTVTFNGTTFTDFIGIFNSGPTLPTISPANGTVDAGCPNQFTTTLVGSQYDWDFGPVATPLTESGANITTTSDVYFSTPGTYWVKVTVLTACCGPVTDSTQVTVQANVYDVTLTASSTSICEGDPITFTANPATYDNYEFFIDGVSVQNGTNNVFTSSAIQQGDSIYVEAFVGSCFANPSDTIVPTVNPVPTVTLASDDPDNEICEGETITFTATPAGYDNYEFFNGTTSLQNGPSDFLFGTIPINNSITVVATDNGCPSLASNAIVTQVNPIPQVSLASSDPNDSICDGDDIIFTALPIGLADYEFFEGVASVQTGISNVYQTNSLANGTAVSVVATSADGCISAPSNVITTVVSPYPSVSISSSDPDNEICEGESITFTASPSGMDSYEFFDGSTTVQNTGSESWTTTGLVAGNSITVEATDLGCTSAPSSAITINIIAAPQVNPGPDVDVCIDGGNVTLAGFTPAGGTWSGTGITNPTGVFSPVTAGVGAHVLSYAASNANCTTTETINAVVHDLPTIDAGTYPPVCLGESVNLSASGADTYSWDPPTDLNNASIANPVSTPAATISYTVTGTDVNGCVNAAQTTLTVEPVPTAEFSATDVCIEDTTFFVNTSQPSAGVTYLWSFGDGQSSTDQNPEVVYQDVGDYDVTLSVTWGNCSDATTSTVTVNPRPSSSFRATPEYTTAIEPLIEFEDLSLNAVSWSWNFGDFTPFSEEQNPTHIYGDTGVHIITLTTMNVFGCTDSISDSIYVAPQTTLYVPSAFRPDKDRINDKFYAYGEDIFFFDFRIFDRWGKQLFFTDDITVGWDGTDSKTGKEVKMGLYVYQILYEDYRGRRLKKLGSVSLLR